MTMHSRSISHSNDGSAGQTTDTSSVVVLPERRLKFKFIRPDPNHAEKERERQLLLQELEGVKQAIHRVGCNWQAYDELMAQQRDITARLILL